MKVLKVEKHLTKFVRATICPKGTLEIEVFRYLWSRLGLGTTFHLSSVCFARCCPTVILMLDCNAFQTPPSVLVKYLVVANLMFSLSEIMQFTLIKLSLHFHLLLIRSLHMG